MSQALTGYAMMEDTPYDTGALYVINTPLMDGAWHLIGLVSEEDVSDESDEELLQIVFLILVVICALGWLLDRFAATAITTPLVDLTSTAQEIGSGDMRYQVGYQNRGDEMGGLARSLEDMKSNLADPLTRSRCGAARWKSASPTARMNCKSRRPTSSTVPPNCAPCMMRRFRS
ncbi:HAMP domain-containing protein [Candidatus Flexifilum breve]|uniref:HAMP domain-containing protein n=1 Tax=Candidatus Flexifilum breve TaxID=3140694 RepID=UPI0031CCB65D